MRLYNKLFANGMFKIKLILSILFSINLTVHAQHFKITPKAGITFAKQDLQLHPTLQEELQQKLMYKVGNTAGVGLEARLFRNTSVLMDILHTQGGYTVKSKHGYNLSQNYTYNYLSIPLSAKMSFMQSKVKPFILVGGYASCLYRLNYQHTDFTGESESTNIVIQKPYSEQSHRYGVLYKYHNRYDYGLQIGAGAAYKLGIGEINLEGRYAHGLVGTHTFDHTGRESYKERTQSNRVFSLMVGYAIPL